MVLQKDWLAVVDICNPSTPEAKVVWIWATWGHLFFFFLFFPSDEVFIEHVALDLQYVAVDDRQLIYLLSAGTAGMYHHTRFM